MKVEPAVGGVTVEGGDVLHELSKAVGELAELPSIEDPAESTEALVEEARDERIDRPAGASPAEVAPIDPHELGTDAQAWAEAFFSVFGPAGPREIEDVDVGTMIGWFANAMGVAEEAGARSQRQANEGSLAKMLEAASAHPDVVGLQLAIPVEDVLSRLDRFADEADAQVTIARHPGNEPAVRWSAEVVWGGEPPDSDKARLSSVQGGAAAYGTGAAARIALTEAVEDAGA